MMRVIHKPQQKYYLYLLYMTSSTESKLKSKYDSSSKKIQELYEQFSVMRRNMYTPLKKNKNEDDSFNMGDKLEPDSIKNLIQVNIPRGPRYRQYTKPEGITTLNFQTQVLLRNAILKNFTSCFMELDKRVDERVCIMEGRLVNLRNLFSQLSNFYKIKTKALKQFKPTPCKCAQVQQLLKEVQLKYSKKIAQMVSTYEHKISLLVKQHQQTSDSSNSKNIPKELKDQLQKLQDKLIVKQQQITNLMKEGSRLRRTVDQHKVLIVEKQNLIEELEGQISQKQNKIIELSKMKTQKISPQVKACLDCNILKQKIESLNKDLQKQKNDNNELQQLVNYLKKQQQQHKKQQSVMKNSTKKKSEWDQSEIQKHQLVASDYQDDHFISDNLKVGTIYEEDYEPLRHTQYFNTNTKRGSYKNEQKIKQLEAELQLVLEQNKLLKSKKDKFEQQCKDNESDQEKFQMQCQILRDQLKNVNANIKILDECAIMGLRQKKVPEETVDKLTSIVIKYKQEYFKKYPKKKKSVKS